MNAFKTCLKNDRKLHMRPTNLLNYLCNLFYSHSLGTWSENYRNEFLCCNLTRRVRGIGPNGMEMPYLICNRDKTNESCRSNVGGSVSSKHPLLSSVTAKGFLLFCRFKVVFEPCPYFTNKKQFMQKTDFKVREELQSSIFRWPAM